MNNLILEAKNLGRTFKEGSLVTEVLRDINLSLAEKEAVAIVGASGSGKSTLLHLLAGLDKPTTGEVRLAGADFSKLSEAARGFQRNKYLGFIYQFHYLIDEMNAVENVMLPLRIGRIAPKEAQKKAEDLLEQVGLGHRKLHKPAELSGGERQRVAIARALITNPKCILADEPTGNLDSKSAEQVIDLMLRLNIEFDTALLVVTHDQEIASRFGKVITLADGAIV